jgi:SulP family sulfate permease
MAGFAANGAVVTRTRDEAQTPAMTQMPRVPDHPTEQEAAPPPAPGLAGWLYGYVPAFDSLRTYSWRALSADLTAGITVATVAVPQSMAYAILAGLPPQYGLYTAIVMTAVGALFASSRQLINGPTNAISIALLSALAVVYEDDRTQVVMVFALLVGLIQLGITFLRLGDLTRYVSHAVIVGFTVGAGALIVLDQLKNMLGLPGRGGPEDHFIKRFWLTMTSGAGWNGPTVMVGLGTIALVLGGRAINDRLRRRRVRLPIPQHLVAVVIVAAVVQAFHLDQQGVKIVGPVPRALPAFELPQVRWDEVRLLAGDAFGIAILGLLEAIAMSKAIATQTGLPLDINQQCLSEGMANLAGGFFQCMPGSGSLTRSAVNLQAGAVSQWSGVFSAATVAATMLLFAPWARYIPQASLAGLLMLAAFRMVDGSQLVFHLRATRFDALIVTATALAAVFVSIEFCIVIGVFLSFTLYIPRAARLQSAELVPAEGGLVRERLPNDPGCPRMLMLVLEGELFFGAAPDVKAALSRIADRVGPETRLVVLFLKRARNPDAAFLDLLRQFHRRLHRRKVELILCGVRPDLARALRTTGLDTEFGPENLLPETAEPGGSTREALTRVYALLGTEVCTGCPRGNGAPRG